VNTENKKIKMIVRVCEYMNTSKTPGFVNSKLEMVQKSFLSLSKLRSINKIDLVIIYDSCSDSFIKKTSSILNGVSIISEKKLGNQGSFGKQISMACEAQPGTIIILGEDDYIYNKGFFTSIVNDIEIGSFVTTYNHPDYESRWTHRIFSYFNKGRKLSTVCSFAGYSEDFLDSRHIFDLYTNSVVGDGGMWKMLTIPLLGVYSSFKELYFDEKMNKLNMLYIIQAFMKEFLKKRKRLVVTHKSYSSHIVHDGFLKGFIY
jgi:hypothetical protein